MEKKIYELHIDPELHSLIPPLTQEERRLLEESIVRSGCDSPLAVWNGTIVDGHNRYEICRRHSIPFGIIEKEFADKDAARVWMLENQLARRNLNDYQRIELAKRFKDQLSRQARQRMLAGVAPEANVSQGGRVTEKLAKIAGVGETTVKRALKIDSEADEATKQALRSGEISIGKAFTQIQEAARTKAGPVNTQADIEKAIRRAASAYQSELKKLADLVRGASPTTKDLCDLFGLLSDAIKPIETGFCDEMKRLADSD